MPTKILSVDDSKTIRLIVAKAFKPFDCEVSEAANGVEGLAAAARVMPDLIVLDITMPVMDGVEMLSKLKSDAALKNIPVIMLTAESGRENVLKIAKMGVRDYLVKPFKEEQLLEKVTRVVNLQPKEAGKGTVRTLNDPLLILVVDDKPAIIQQISEGLASTPWKVIGKQDLASSVAEIKTSKFDAVFTSLTLPNDEGMNLFQQLRSNPLTKPIPVFGMCLKSDAATQTRAEQAGFTGVVNKPIDMEMVQIKLIKALNIDISTRYFATDGDVQLVMLPAKISTHTTGDIERFLQPKIEEMVNAGMTKLIIDLSKVVEVDVSLVKIIIGTMQKCQEFNIRTRIVGNEQSTGALKGFSETSDLTLDPSLEAAKGLFK
ncbi:MAG: response regulator [Verrucomicrobiae bacterium]|nr:response regulator [Verrucomicrobiae bacterium]